MGDDIGHAMEDEMNISVLRGFVLSGLVLTCSVFCGMSVSYGAEEVRSTTVNLNVLGLSQGEIGAWIDWGGDGKITPSLGFVTYTREEDRPNVGGAEVPTRRTFAEVGVAWQRKISPELGLTLSPFIAFGQEVDLISVSQKSGAGVRLFGRAHVNESLSIVVGGIFDWISNSNRQNVILGLGYELR